MSSGVDQIKPVLTGSKEEKNIPWSQQVDEASCENLTITSNDENLASIQSPPKFQYPPFKENHSSVNFKSRKNSNTEISKKYGRSAYHNSKRDEHGVTWGGSNLKNPNVENNSLIHRESRDRLSNHGNIECSNINKYVENKVSSQPPVTQKKTTWALIASQPAKHTLKVSLTSTQKKKGPGMPPPPMVPGKHDLDATAWEIPPSNPPPVPSPPLHIDFSQHENGLIDTTQSFGHSHDSLRKENNKSLELVKDDNRNSIHRSRYTPNSHVRKTWNNIHASNNTNRRHITTAENGVQRKMENIRKNPYLGIRNDQERGNQIYHKSENDSNENISTGNEISSQTSQAVLDELRIKNNYNPSVLDMKLASSARFFVIKSYSEDDIHRSIKYEIWCSTENGNKRLDDAFKDQENGGGTVLLFFSVNGSGHFCGVAQMMTSVDYKSTSSVWSQDKWKGKFKVKWLYVKDVPNYNFRHIKLENNENKTVTHSRDTQEVPNSKGVEVLQIIHSFEHDTSIFDDFHHYEIKQVEGCAKKFVNNDPQSLRGNSPNGRNNQKLMDERDRDFDRGSTRHFVNSVNNNFRERNRSGFQNFSDSKTSSDYVSRYSQKSEIVRRDKINKQIHREREHLEDRIKNGHKFRTDLRDAKIDNEFEDQR